MTQGTILLLESQLVSSLLVGKEVCRHGWDSWGTSVKGKVSHTKKACTAAFHAR